VARNFNRSTSRPKAEYDSLITGIPQPRPAVGDRQTTNSFNFYTSSLPASSADYASTLFFTSGTTGAFLSSTPLPAGVTEVDAADIETYFELT
jgi:hypothetical protein